MKVKFEWQPDDRTSCPPKAIDVASALINISKDDFPPNLFGAEDSIDWLDEISRHLMTYVNVTQRYIQRERRNKNAE